MQVRSPAIGMAHHYLTVQDILWINLQVTKTVRTFSYARLEEATFYQYAYGESRTLFPQAARFLGGFIHLAPFDQGNRGTALVACLTFLAINGHPTDAGQDEIAAWLDRAVSGSVTAETIGEIARPSEDAHGPLVPDIRAAAQSVIDRYGEVARRELTPVADSA